MAESENTSNQESRTFDKSLNRDINDFHLPPNQWTRARNAINNSITGDLGKLGNEPANLLCVTAPYTIIGFIHIIEDKWAVYSTDGTNSEIGLFTESDCGTSKAAYVPIVNAACLNFKVENLIIGVSRQTSTCTYKLYWDDGLNPSRNLEIDVDNPVNNYPFLPPPAAPGTTNPNTPIPYIQNCVDSNGPAPGGCIICTNTPVLDCDKLRVALFIDPICPRVEKGIGGGNLLNGSYFVVMAYAIKGQKIGDWYVSNVQGLFDHNNSATSLDVFIDRIDPDYDEIIIGLGSVVNAQTVVRQAGIYSSRQTLFNFDTIFDQWPAIPIEQLPLMTPIVNKSDAMYNVGDYLIRVGPTSKQDFNYQPLANQITAKWQAVEYPADYYHKGNNQTGYMRDEVYPFFIQWIYDTGDKSAEYHIPGRPPVSILPDKNPVAPGGNVFAGETEYWQVYNTATYTAVSIPNGDGGTIVAEGLMGYWESTEFYPDKKPQIWNSSAHPWSAITSLPYANTTFPDYNLCGTPIRHHKFPEDTVGTNATLNNIGGTAIRIMGVKFENIKAPRDNNGKLIPGITGYRILRGSRNGNKTIIAKGIINNLHEYEIPESGGKKSLYPNYPYNDLRDDPFLSTTRTKTTACILPGPGGVTNFNPQPGSDFKRDYFTFHSPETNFNNPFLAAKEFRIYGNAWGKVEGKFDLSEKHPQEKLISDFAFVIAAISGIGVAVLNQNGERRVNKKLPEYRGFSHRETYSVTNTNAGTHSQAPYVTQAIDTNISPGSGPNTITTTIPFPPLPILTGINETTTNSPPIPAPPAAFSGPDPLFLAAIQGLPALLAPIFAGYQGLVFASNLAQATLGVPTVDPATSALQSTSDTTVAVPSNGAYGFSTTEIQQTDGALDRTGPLGILSAAPTFFNYLTDGADSVIRLIRAIVKYRDFAVRYHSHGFYDTLNLRPVNMTFRTELKNQQYINPEILQYDTTYKINNLYRQRTVAINTTTTIIDPIIDDRTRYTNSQLTPPSTKIQDLCNRRITNSITSTVDGLSGQICSSWYGALKVRIRNQYGQLNNIVSLPTSPCYIDVAFDPVTGNILPNKGDSTPVLFGGDVYVNRYTEKNTFLFYYDWLYGQPDGAQFNYKQHEMVPYPKYWADFSQFQTNDFTSTVFSNILSPSWPPGANLITPSDFYALDGPPCFSTGFAGGIFDMDKKGWFYLFNSGVRDFFVESEINVAYRDYGEPQDQRFYDPYSGSDTKDLFDTKIIKSGNYYKYDKSLSISQLFLNYTSWASMQATTYDPYIAETCFVYQPKKLIYSLPAQFEGLKDGWLAFLPNNYYNFQNLVTCIKPVNKSGAMIFFDAASPVQFQGLDQLQTDLGTKLTIGDGGLFSQPVQALINVDTSHEYASCQNRLSVINTPAGVFWISQNQGKVFSLTGSIKELSNESLKWWFAEYLPYKIVEEFPDFDLLDNPVIGVGCQSVYDNQNGLIYFSKIDYSLRKDISETLTYIKGSNKFTVDQTGLTVELGDPLFFNDASWTTSYDPKTGAWIGWHDWHPTLNMPGKNTFMTINPNDKRGIWIHNVRCDLYCNYYGIDYPFEVEFMVNTGQTVNTLRSIQYIMEAYKYAKNCYDRFHVLDYNFDEAIIHNTEQVSGLLKLNLNPKDNPTAILGYPVIGVTDIQILFSKEENKYRFNQFWDVTDDRGEFFNPTIPGFAQRPIWNTEDNGYIRLLNPINLNYAKNPFQRKKFRHYTTSVWLCKKVSGDKKMLVMIADTKELYSPR